MASTNNVIFDFSAIVDIEMSIFKFLLKNKDIVYELKEVIDIDKYNICREKNHTKEFLMHNRIQGPHGLLREFIKPMRLSEYLSLRDTLYETLQNVILTDEYAEFTRAKTVISAYNKTGNGVIQSTILCSAEEKKFLQKYIQANYLVDIHENIDMKDRSRIVSGDFRNLLKVKFEGPRSIVILDYRENFLEEDKTIPRPELVITLGDIHDIKVFQTYNLVEINIKG